MTSKKLITITDLNLINKLKGREDVILVYPLTFFCVGIPLTFDINDIKEENAFIFVNRVFDTKAIDDFKKLVVNLPENIKGIIFDDVGIVNVIKNISITKILYLSHFNTNYESINYFNEYVDSVMVSTDITEEEIDTIISKSTKPVSLFTFGLVPSFYSRRTLITSYNKHFELNENLQKEVTVADKKFITIENEYGTIMYHYPYFNGLSLLNKQAKYFFYFPLLLDGEESLNIIDNRVNIEYDKGFLNTKTIYKLPLKEGK